MCGIAFSVVKGCTDDPTFIRDGRDCASQVAIDISECYDATVESSCCASCQNVKLGIIGR